MENYQEIQKILQENNINMSDLAKIAKKLNNNPLSLKEEVPKKEKKVPEKEWKVFYTYPDIVIDYYLNGKKKQQLVVMPLHDGYYIKKFTYTKDQVSETIENLTAENYIKFSSGMPTFECPKDYWITKIFKGKDGFSNLTILIGENFTEPANYSSYFLKEPISSTRLRNTLKEMVRHKCIRAIDDYDRMYTTRCIENYMNFPTLMKEFMYNEDYPKVNKLLTDTTGCQLVRTIVNWYGIDCTRRYLKEFETSLITMDSRSYPGFIRNKSFYRDTVYVSGIRSNRIKTQEEKDMNPYQIALPSIKMNFDSFLTYTLYQSTRMGYADNMSTFYDCWYDCYQMQMIFYNKVVDKYPEHLQEFHDQLAYKIRIYAQVIDKMKYKAAYEHAKRFEYKTGNWLFLAIPTQELFLDEAVQQSNCLASYLDRFIAQATMIIVMRNKENPNKSYITIEYDEKNNRITQAYLALNHRPSNEDEEILDKYRAHLTKLFNGQIEPMQLNVSLEQQTKDTVE